MDLNDADARTLAELPRLLVRHGYSDAYTVYGPLNLRLDRWADDLDLLPADLQDLFRLFLLNQRIPARRAEELLGEPMLDALRRFSVLLPAGDDVHTGSLVVLPAFGYFLIAERPGVDPIAYFGDDSAALAAHLMPGPGDRCLDLCTGPGIQALVLSGRARQVVGVEVNPVAAAHAELNMVLNRLADRVEIRVGDLYEPVTGEQFDFVSANPPLLPFVPELPYPFVGHGGADGLDVVRRILHGLDAVLAEEGLCQLLGTCLGTWDGPLSLTELDGLARAGSWRFQLTLPTALALVPGSTMFDGLATTCAMAGRLDVDEVKAALQDHLHAMGASHLYLYFLTVSRERRQPGLAVTRHFERRVGFWYIT